ncbi:unnamed protein product [Caenorhabditis auriculariae]|uniref:Uncharacterized protein n=1 Tax=Caenorhabditis auriculariae TaxID=2777116 RepID=A0A8S1HNG6_9PELO|nr:unnamed protein product [Caenorhabditis auriculariae]
MASVHTNSLLLVISIFGLGLVLSVQSVYYIKVFFDEFHLPSNYLKIVQIIYLVWNAVNDPLMGYMQDIGCGMKWIMDRRKVVLYAGPALCASFLLFWFPWSTTVGWVTALHLLVSLCIYDTLFTLVLSAYCGLCVEASGKHQDRVRILVYGEVATILGGSLIFPLERIPHSQEYFWMFQSCCVAIAVMAAVLLLFSGSKMRIERPTNEAYELGDEQDLKGDSSSKHALQVSWQIIKEPRFICLVGAQFFRIMRFMANENYLLIYVGTLLVEGGFFQNETTSLGLYYVALRSSGSILFLLLWMPTNRFGSQAVIQALNVVSIANILVALTFSQNNLLCLSVFLVIENAITRCGWQGFYLVVAGEVIDTDVVQNNRKKPLSTMIFTLKALFTKPAEQLAPVIVLQAFLENGGFPKLSVPCQDYLSGSGAGNLTSLAMESSLNLTAIGSTTDPLSVACASLRTWTFTAVVAFPAICVAGESLFVAIDQLVRRRINSVATSD